MGTRALIEITAGKETFYLYRAKDGDAVTVMANLGELLEDARGRWDGAEPGQLVALFLARQGDPGSRLQPYVPVTAPPDDAENHYRVAYVLGEWRVTLANPEKGTP